MRRVAIAGMIAALAWTDVPAQAPRNGTAPSEVLLLARLTDDVIRDAVRQALAEAPADLKGASPTVLSGDRYRDFSRKVDDAKVPGCLNPDALKHQPASVQTKDWVIGLSGTLAAPLWLVAAATGKCH